MAEWSEQPDKVLCRCGVVSWTATMFEGNPPRYMLQEACPGCGRTDDVDEIGSITKMSQKKAAATIEAVCDLLEIQPLHVMNGRTASQIKELAQHLEDLGRPLAAERLLKGWEAFKGGLFKGAKELFPGRLPENPQNVPTAILVGRSPAKGRTQYVSAVPGCIACKDAVMDYKDNHIPLCPKCRTIEGPALVPFLETELEGRLMSMDRVRAGVSALKERIAALKGSPNR